MKCVIICIFVAIKIFVLVKITLNLFTVGKAFVKMQKFNVVIIIIVGILLK